MDVIDRINLRLAEIGKNGAEMSRDLGLSNSAYSQWNTHKYRPSKKSLSIMAPYLQTTVEYLLTGKEQPAPTDGDGPDSNDKVILDFLFSLPYERIRGILVALAAPEEVIAALDRIAQSSKNP